MFARRFANQRGFGRREKMSKKQDVEHITGVLREVYLNQEATKENKAMSKIPVACKDHKQNKRVPFRGTVAKQLTEGKAKNANKVKKVISDVMPTNLSVYQDDVIMTCDEEDTFDEPYARDIHRYLKHIESKCCPSLEFMQKDITDDNRRVLLAWMRDVKDFLELHQETFHLAITIIDMVVQKGNFKLHEYQLLGLVGFFLAAKFMERYVPEVDTLMYLASYAYNSQLILQKEKEVLNLLDYDLNLPTPSWFLEYYAQDTESTSIQQLSAVLIDLFTLDSTSVSMFPPSIRAAASLLVAGRMRGTNSSQWMYAVQAKCGYSDHELAKANARLLYLIQSIDRSKMCSIQERVVALL